MTTVKILDPARSIECILKPLPRSARRSYPDGATARSGLGWKARFWFFPRLPFTRTCCGPGRPALRGFGIPSLGDSDEMHPSQCQRCRRACISVKCGFDQSMFPYVALTKDKQWQPGPYAGVELMPLHRNEKTDGVTVLRKF